MTKVPTQSERVLRMYGLLFQYFLDLEKDGEMFYVQTLFSI